MTTQEPETDGCTGFYKCETCGFRTAQSRKCPRCGGEVKCDA